MADFAYNCHHIEPGTPNWNVLVTEMEGLRKKRRLVSTLPTRTWALTFRLQTLAERDALLAHYNAQKAGLTPFHWTSVPTYVATVAYYNVAYKSYKESLVAGTLWEIVIELEESL